MSGDESSSLFVHKLQPSPMAASAKVGGKATVARKPEMAARRSIEALFFNPFCSAAVGAVRASRSAIKNERIGDRGSVNYVGANASERGSQPDDEHSKVKEVKERGSCNHPRRGPPSLALRAAQLGGSI